MAQQFAAEGPGHFIGMGALGEGLFGGKNVALQPIEQLFAVAGDMVHLRIVNVGIDKARHNQPGQMFDRHLRKLRGQIGIGPARHDSAVFDHQQTIGLMLPRRANEQAAATQKIEKAELQPGDLVFFNTMKRAFSHVGIYVGEGKFIHSPKPGAQVRVEDMRNNYWQHRFDGARRVQAAQATQAMHTTPAVSAVADFQHIN